ncbi:para-nitrobenzyl esterase-like [Eurosta solidaginis]|uniref:para-nitrobenzyl esterase-like n=1 Tax=Eurosta solidaginis TaxID=178769 RepID=UPI003530826C
MAESASTSFYPGAGVQAGDINVVSIRHKTMKLATGVLCMFATVALATAQSAIMDPPQVIIPTQGPVLGAIDETAWTNQKIMAFRSIPFAESPKGPLRFLPPKAKAAWTDVYDAREFGRICPNYENVLALNDTQRKEDLEDCLNLSVYSKDLSAKKPVMFYVHGGIFGFGNAALYPPHYLMEKDIVLVVTQYRIGSLGFMSTFTSEMPGNQAIMDVQLALDWVQKNIHAFGGDPTKVTIFGQSAGAGMTSGTVISPKTPEGHIKRSIVQSASILAPWCINRIALEQAKRFCESLGCQGCDDVQKQNECMKNADTFELLTVARQDMFAPVVGDLNGVLPEEPKTLIEKFSKNIPVMAGFTKHDGSFLMAQNFDAFTAPYGGLANMTVRQFANLLVDTGKDTTGLPNNLLLHTLIDPAILDTNNHDAAWYAYYDIISDVNIKSPVIAYASAMQRRIAPVYAYSFDYAGEYSRFNDQDNSQLPFEGGVYHSDDNIYLFDRFPLNADDTEFAKKMVHLWYTFAAEGEPKVLGHPEITTKPKETEAGPYFHINKDVTFGTNILTELTAVSDDPESYKLIR